eukprot:Clim_evm5s40 gene=Clim_evmTU5s40
MFGAKKKTGSRAYDRVRREIAEVAKDPTIKELGMRLEPVGDSLSKLYGEIPGPPDTPYEKGQFALDIEIPEQYPFVPPKVKFATKIWHPNVSSQTGAICLDILKDAWAAAMTLRTVLLSIQALMSSPEPDSPQDAVVAGQFKRDHKEFEKTAREWTAKHATDTVDAEKLKTLTDMGFPEDKCRAMLKKTGGDVDAAVQALLSE